MRKLIMQQWISLDGYMEDREGTLKFFENLGSDSNKYSDRDQLKFLETIDTILLGRVTYKLFVDFWPTATTDQEVIADKLNSTRRLIFSNTLTSAPWGKWPAAEVIRGDAAAEIRKLKELPGKDMVLWGSVTLSQSLIKANVIDEYHIQICPVVSGGGRALFPDARQYSNLQLIDTKTYDTGTIFARYKVK